MEAVSYATNERARKFAALWMQRISERGQNKIAEQIGVSAPTISRWVSDDLDRACQMAVESGLKLVPVEMQCYPPRVMQNLLEMARDRLNSVHDVTQLQWED